MPYGSINTSDPYDLLTIANFWTILILTLYFLTLQIRWTASYTSLRTDHLIYPSGITRELFS